MKVKPHFQQLLLSRVKSHAMMLLWKLWLMGTLLVGE